MYTVFIVFESGHNIKLGNGSQYLENAIEDAKYHAKYATPGPYWFEVWFCGNKYWSSKT